MDKKNFIQVNCSITFYLTNQICIIPGISLHYISPIYWDRIKTIFPENTADILYEDNISDAIHHACNGRFTSLELLVATTGKNCKAVLIGDDDCNLLH